jgi:NAD kinase
MKVFLFGKNSNEILSLVKPFGFEITDKNPELIFSYGGDGTLIESEFAFPGVPKLLLRGSKICKRCSLLGNEEILKRLAAGQYEIEKRIKLEAAVRGEILTGVNDIMVRNQDHRHAMRYHIWLNNQRINSAENEIIGDGIVAATPFGSTGYYRSITDSFFEIGIGLAFNNSTEQADHMVLPETAEIKLQIARGPAIVYADNQEKSVAVAEGDEVAIKKSTEEFNLIKIL